MYKLVFTPYIVANKDGISESGDNLVLSDQCKGDNMQLNANFLSEQNKNRDQA